MSFAGLGLLVLAAAGLVFAYAEQPVLGLAPDDLAVLAALIGIGVILAGWISTAFRQRWTHGIGALAVWGLLYAALIGVYAQRDELAGTLTGLLDRAIGEVDPGRTAVTAAGEVVVARRADGSFTLAGKINQHAARFMFDTGASTVVLTSETAAAAGLRPESLSFSVPVSTANGRTLAAPVTIEALSVGPIIQRKVRALVTRPGILHENLLGMTFLERLTSYEVRGNRLILRPGVS